MICEISEILPNTSVPWESAMRFGIWDGLGLAESKQSRAISG